MHRLYLMGCLHLIAVLTGAVWIAFGGLTGASASPTPEPSRSRHSWFQQTKPYCNAVEVELRIGQNPPPEGWSGTASAAACYAIAGKIDRARTLLSGIEADGERDNAVNLVFQIVHPVADAGHDDAAGPIMRMVVDFQPRNYMALYHAGIAEYNLAEAEQAREHLERFLEIYGRDDGWRRNAKVVLARIEAGEIAHVGNGHGAIR